MGLADHKIVVAEKDKLSVTKQLLNTLIDEDTEIVTMIYGEEATEEEVEAVVSYIEETYPDVEVEVHDGKQPLYPFIFSVE